MIVPKPELSLIDAEPVVAILLMITLYVSVGSAIASLKIGTVMVWKLSFTDPAGNVIFPETEL